MCGALSKKSNHLACLCMAHVAVSFEHSWTGRPLPGCDGCWIHTGVSLYCPYLHSSTSTPRATSHRLLLRSISLSAPSSIHGMPRAESSTLSPLTFLVCVTMSPRNRGALIREPLGLSPPNLGLQASWPRNRLLGLHAPVLGRLASASVCPELEIAVWACALQQVAITEYSDLSASASCFAVRRAVGHPKQAERYEGRLLPNAHLVTSTSGRCCSTACTSKSFKCILWLSADTLRSPFYHIPVQGPASALFATVLATLTDAEPQVQTYTRRPDQAVRRTLCRWFTPVPHAGHLAADADYWLCCW